MLNLRDQGIKLEHILIHTHSHMVYPKGYSGGPDASMIRLVGKPIHILHRANLYRVGLRSNGRIFDAGVNLIPK